MNELDNCYDIISLDKLQVSKCQSHHGAHENECKDNIILT